MDEVSIATVDPRDPEVQAALHRYFSEITARMAHVVLSAEDFAVDDFVAPGGAFYLARSGAELVGSGAVRALDVRIGEIKRMWVAPDQRGQGLGTRLLRTLEGAAQRDFGYESIRLDTHEVLVEAIHLYETNGYRQIAAYHDHPDPTHFYEKSLTVN